MVDGTQGERKQEVLTFSTANTSSSRNSNTNRRLVQSVLMFFAEK
jgi:hypothetical protein